jgi:hypothetical protein
MAEFEAKK